MEQVSLKRQNTSTAVEYPRLTESAVSVLRTFITCPNRLISPKKLYVLLRIYILFTRVQSTNSPEKRRCGRISLTEVIDRVKCWKNACSSISLDTELDFIYKVCVVFVLLFQSEHINFDWMSISAWTAGAFIAILNTIYAELLNMLFSVNRWYIFLFITRWEYKQFYHWRSSFIKLSRWIWSLLYIMMGFINGLV